MYLVVRSALQQDYEDLNTLFAEGDRVHHEALPQVFQPRTGPVRTPEFLAEILSNADAALFVAEDHGRLIGFIRSSVRIVPPQPGIISRRFLSIEELAVMPSSRRQGVGQALIERVERWASELAITDLELHVWEFNTEARALYEKLGYITRRRTMGKQLP
jgi:ribosomal protein S18 acetylase RimI-like enzyme